MIILTKMFLSKLVLFFAATVCVSSSVQEADLTLTLFYEGLCPGCHEFILTQLYPSYEKLADSLKLDLVPFGWSQSSRSADGKVTFDCQHGDEECYINRIHACVLDQNPS
ncbi:gamma-interferon-inducible lysosomal thiol reductase-like [Diabrotica undecimpunctata]